MSDVADHDQVELAVAGVGAGREHQAFARAVEAAQHQRPHRQALLGFVVDPDAVVARVVGQRRERRHQDVADRAEPLQERHALRAPGNRGGGADDREHEAVARHLAARIALGVGAEHIDVAGVAHGDGLAGLAERELAEGAGEFVRRAARQLRQHEVGRDRPIVRDHAVHHLAEGAVAADGDQTPVTGIDGFLRQLRRVIGRTGHRDVVVIDRAEMLFEFGPDLRPALAATALVRHRIDDDPGFHGNLRLRRQSRQLDVGGGMKQPESELFADATNAAGALWKLGELRAATQRRFTKRTRSSRPGSCAGSAPAGRWPP